MRHKFCSFLNTSGRDVTHLTLLIFVKFLVGALLFVWSARWLSNFQFFVFSQLFLYFTLINLLLSGSISNGVVQRISSTRNLKTRAAVLAAAISLIVATGALLLSLTLFFGAEMSKWILQSNIGVQLIPALTFFSALSSVGQALCAYQTGSGRIRSAILTQSISIGLSCCWAVVPMYGGNGQLSLIGFAAGMAMTAPVSLLLMGRSREVFSNMDLPRWVDLRMLIRFSSVYLATAMLMPASLFILRLKYLEEFGQTELTHWLTANRISESTTQIIALYMSQLFLPRFCLDKNFNAQKSLITHTTLILMVLMVSIFITFFMLSDFLVEMILTERFLGSISAIRFYMAGDVFRVASALVLNIAIAENNLRNYFFIELFITFLFSVLVIILMSFHIVSAPYLSYLFTYLLSSIAIMFYVFYRFYNTARITKTH